MNLFIYSDESGVFDKAHNKFFVFGGLVFSSKDARDVAARKYIAAEKVIRIRENFTADNEVKATTISNADKGKLYRSLNQVQKFGVVVDQARVLDSIFSSKKSKQRYLDYAYKIAVKRKFEVLISRGLLNREKVEGLYFCVDEHTTATDGLYELRESLEQEFKYGTYNWNFSTFLPPIFPNLKEVNVRFCNSSKVTLVRASDIVANKLFFAAKTGTVDQIKSDNFNIVRLP